MSKHKSKHKEEQKTKTKNKNKGKKLKEKEEDKKLKEKEDEENLKKNRKLFPYEFNMLLHMDRILNNTKNKDNIKIILKKDNIKGTGVYATQFIEEGETIAYYRIRIFNQSTYKSPTNFIYTFSIYGTKGKKCDHLIGDIDSESIPEPLNNIPYWGMFVNEPFTNQDINSEVDINTDYNYIERKRVRVGMYLVYKIVAKRDIDIDEEITIYYGDEYERDYELKLKY